MRGEGARERPPEDARAPGVTWAGAGRGALPEATRGSRADP